MDVFFQIAGMVGCISIVVYGGITFLFCLVADHKALEKLREDVNSLDKRTYREYWAFNARIDALEQQGKHDGEIKAKG